MFGSWWWEQRLLKVGEADVREVFSAHLPDVPIIEHHENISSLSSSTSPPFLMGARFFKGYVRDSMPVVQATLPPPSFESPEASPDGDIAILRIDLDMYGENIPPRVRVLLIVAMMYLLALHLPHITSLWPLEIAQRRTSIRWLYLRHAFHQAVSLSWTTITVNLEQKKL